MKRLSRDTWIGIGVITTLIGITLVAALLQASEPAQPGLSSWSTAPNGAQALRLWLEDLHYPVNAQLTEQFEIPADAGLVLMLEPTQVPTWAEWDKLETWVEAGGTLLIAGNYVNAILAMQHYECAMPGLDTAPGPAAALPFWFSPPLTTLTNTHTLAALSTPRTDFTPLLLNDTQTVIGVRPAGQGKIILSTLIYPFTNAGLKEAGNAELVLNLITAAAPGSGVWFDEWHHGQKLQAEQVIGPENWLRYKPAGQALLYTALVIFGFLLWRGRHFGRSEPLRRETLRRAPLEYITAMANLHRRAGHRRAVLQQYHHRLKRHLGQRYRLDPTLPDPEYVARLAACRPQLDAAALRSLLARLTRTQISESDLVQCAAEVSRWMQTH